MKIETCFDFDIMNSVSHKMCVLTSTNQENAQCK